MTTLLPAFEGLGEAAMVKLPAPHGVVEQHVPDVQHVPDGQQLVVQQVVVQHGVVPWQQIG